MHGDDADNMSVLRRTCLQSTVHTRTYLHVPENLLLERQYRARRTRYQDVNIDLDQSHVFIVVQQTGQSHAFIVVQQTGHCRTQSSTQNTVVHNPQLRTPSYTIVNSKHRRTQSLTQDAAVHNR